MEAYSVYKMEEEIKFLKDRIVFYESVILSLIQTKDTSNIIEQVLDDITIFEKKTTESFTRALCPKLKNVPIEEVKYLCIQLYDKLKPEIIKLYNQVKDNDMQEQHKDDQRIKNFHLLKEPAFQENLLKLLKRNNK